MIYKTQLTELDEYIFCRVNLGNYRNYHSRCNTIINMIGVGNFYFLEDIETEDSNPYFHEDWISIVNKDTCDDI